MTERRPDSDAVTETQLAAMAFSSVAEGLFNGNYTSTDKNPIYAMEAFVVCHHVGLSPPKWALDWLAEAFGDYLESNCEANLEKLLGVKRGPGKTLAVKEHQAVGIEGTIMGEIGRLTLIGISIERAAEMVAARLESKGLKRPEPETLQQRFIKRGWSKGFKLAKQDCPKEVLQAIQAALSTYPPETIPPEFK